MPEIKITLGDILKDRNMTQTELVKLTGIRSQAISNLSRGLVERVTLEHLCKIMTALEITDVGEILMYINESTAQTVNEEPQPIADDPLDEPIELLGLPAKIYYAIKKSWVYDTNTIRNLIDVKDTILPKTRGIGPASIEVINKTLNEYLERHR